MNLINYLIQAGFEVCVRWHPGLLSRDVDKIIRLLDNLSTVNLSDPASEPVSSFLGRISCLIAGNSSIHLEAALSGVLPIYYDLTLPDKHDYYGYVKNRLAKYAATETDLVELLKNTTMANRPDDESVRYYSSTYHTEWEGKEGELVASCLMRLSKGQNLPVEPIVYSIHGPEVLDTEIWKESASDIIGGGKSYVE